MFFCLTFISEILRTLTAEDPPNLDEGIREMNLTLQKENASLHALNTALHEKHHTMSLKVSCATHSSGPCPVTLVRRA